MRSAGASQAVLLLQWIPVARVPSKDTYETTANHGQSPYCAATPFCIQRAGRQRSLGLCWEPGVRAVVLYAVLHAEPDGEPGSIVGNDSAIGTRDGDKGGDEELEAELSVLESSRCRSQ